MSHMLLAVVNRLPVLIVVTLCFFSIRAFGKINPGDYVISSAESSGALIGLGNFAPGQTSVNSPQPVITIVNHPSMQALTWSIVLLHDGNYQMSVRLLNIKSESHTPWPTGIIKDTVYAANAAGALPAGPASWNISKVSGTDMYSITLNGSKSWTIPTANQQNVKVQVQPATSPPPNRTFRFDEISG